MTRKCSGGDLRPICTNNRQNYRFRARLPNPVPFSKSSRAWYNAHMGVTLFDSAVSTGKLHPSYMTIRGVWPDHPGRSMMEEIFAEYEDIDGNFLEQFQTTGFDSRCLELYLFALLKRGGYTLDRTQPNPDFIAERDDVKVAIEATTVNPPTSGPVAKSGHKISELSFEERLVYDRHELAIRFGSPLFSKLKKQYWNLDHCKDLPLVIVIQAFHDEHALAFSDNALARYLYGLDQTTGQWNADGSLEVNTNPVSSHDIKGKSIPSNFFALPDAEHVSAVVFTNSGSLAKFDRMGFQHGYGNESFVLTRFGTALNPDPDAMDPTLFKYDVGQPPFVETWGQGLVVNHNPRAMIPLPQDFFGPVVNACLKDGRLSHDANIWHPIASKTHVLHIGDLKSKLPGPLLTRPAVAVEAIKRMRFVDLVGFSYESNPLFEELGWFADMSESFVGVILHDKTDDDWGWMVMARDPYFAFRAIESEHSMSHRREACHALQARIAELVQEPKRIFVQD